jgi:lysophospholipase L1-like esterase
MRRYVVAFIGIVAAASMLAGPVAYGSASMAGGVLQSHGLPPVTTANVTVQPGASQTRPEQAVTKYVAMGDSVAAGAGLPPLSEATVNDETCDRSPEAYPYRIAERLQTTVVQLACSGAKVDEGIYGAQTRNGARIPAQLPTAFTNGSPDLMTATIGANDIRWNQFVRQCYVTRCGFAIDSARTKIYRTDLRIELTRMLYQINTRSAGDPPQVLISGYYSPIASTECLATNRITPDEVSWLNDQTARMNQAIRSVVALFSFAEFIPIDFTGHEVCSSDPWVQGLEATAPIHPTSAGQAAIAESFLSVLNR